MQGNLHQSPYSEHGRKIAIPKLPPRPSKERHEKVEKEERVARACKTCRKRKVRCSGDVPRCTSCERGNLVCVYDSARRDRLAEALRLNQDLVSLLKTLEGRVDDEDKRAINEVLHNVEDDLVSLESVPSVKALGKRPREQSSGENRSNNADHGEAFVTASVGSNEDLDFLDEDLMRNREARETGYIGQNSEVQWLRSVQRQAERGSANSNLQRHGPPGTSSGAANERIKAMHERRQNTSQGSMHHTTDATFYLDNDDIEIDIAVDPYELPDPGVAEHLFNCYLETVHNTFPLMPEDFEDQFRRYIQSAKHQHPYEVPVKWRITMNLLFAIGAKYSQLIGAPWRGDERDHLVYMTRAIHLLRLNDPLGFITAPTIDRVQATGTFAFYFLAIGHVSRAWIMIGISIRLALALGLHLRNENASLDDAKKEPLVRTWWCLHAIECLASSLTGRPPVIGDADCTVTMPKSKLGSPSHDANASRPASRLRKSYSSPQSSVRSGTSQSDKSTDGSIDLVAYIRLNIISQKVLLDLYSPRTAARSWEHVQNRITELLNEVEEWANIALPSDDLRSSNWTQRPDFDRECFLFRIYYWSTRILITRPCLCRIERRIASESSRSANFNAKMAEVCVYAARQVTGLFPEQPDTTLIYSRGPWWNIVHIIMQSMAVLLLEMTYEGQNMKEDKADILSCIKKLMRWLRAMRTNDPVASRAHDVVYKISNTSTSGLRDQVSELVDDDHSQSPQAQPWERHQEFAFPTQPEPWDMPIYPEDSSQTLPPPFLNEQFSNPIHPFPVQYDPSIAFSFGNPFMTTFDENPPIVDMQNLWWQSAPTENLSIDPSGLGLGLPPQDQLPQVDPEMQYNDWTQPPDANNGFDNAPN